LESARHPFRLEPQEYAYGVLYLIVLGRLAWAGALWSGVAGVFGLMVLGTGVVIARCRQLPSTGRWTARRWYFIATMPVAYWAMTPAVTAFAVNRAAWLQAADQWLLGMSVEARVAPLLHPWLTEVLSFAYIAFFPLLAFGLIAHARGVDVRGVRILRVFGTLYGLGFAGYAIVPAAGPYLEGTANAADLLGGIGASLNHFMVHQGSNRVDCFPSLHCAMSGAVLAFEVYYARRRAWITGLVVAAIWLSTVYLRQHYFVDVLAGALLLGLVLAVVWRWPMDPSERLDSGHVLGS
jgi:membrane-associated phospholipid phosphatase